MRGFYYIMLVFLVATFFLAYAPVVLGQKQSGVIVVDMQGDFTTYKNGSVAVNGSEPKMPRF